MKLKAFLKKSPIVRSSSFLKGFREFRSSPALELATAETCNMGMYPKPTYRLINHWDTLGIINDSRKEKKGWRKFSPSDLAWQAVILSLRGFGVSNEKILDAKKHLIDLKEENGARCPLFEYYIFLTSYPDDVFILLFEDGLADISTAAELKDSDVQDNLIRLNLTKLIASQDFNAVHFVLTESEQILIKAVREGRFKSIKIVLKDGKIKRLDKKENVDCKKRIIELLQEGNFQNIEVLQNNGQIVSIKRTIQQKL